MSNHDPLDNTLRELGSYGVLALKVLFVGVGTIVVSLWNADAALLFFFAAIVMMFLWSIHRRHIRGD